MRRTSFAGMHCSMARSLEVMGDWWTPLILRDLHLGLTRFDELAEDLGISRNLLTTRLAALVERGLVERRRYSERPPRHAYHLTEAGRDLVPVLVALTAWGDRWLAPKQGPPLRLQHRTCGKFFTPTVACSHCGETVTAEDVVAHGGPGGRTAPGTRLVAKVLQDRGRDVAGRRAQR
ncbi:MAG TPA: helix-turn-helix domain-containing protein [Candidatus Eisenbacteria bacterium]|nr:helix-turn-helix domain-containing protein [Candidatus Eisenbacteria bacterium]